MAKNREHDGHGNINTYRGHIHHGEGGMPAPMSKSVERTNRVNAKVESKESPRAVDRSSGKASRGEVPHEKVRKERAMD